MSFSYGFYNSKNGDRKYDALDVSRIFDGIIKDGVYMNVGNQFKVAVIENMQLSVDPGRAWFNHTWNFNDSKFPVTISDSDVLLPRIDAIVIEINNESRTNTIKVVTGTAATNATKPTLTNTTNLHQYPIAYVTVPANSTSIEAGNIENAVGTSACPFVTGVLEGMNIDNLIAQWNAQFVNWFERMKGQLTEDAAGNLQIEIDDIFNTVVAADANTATGLAFIVNGNTLNTPYKAGETENQNGIIFNGNKNNNGYNTQFALMQGSVTPWMRVGTGTTWYDWDQILTLGNTTPGQIGAMAISGGTFTANVMAYSTNRSGYNLRNIGVKDSSGNGVSTNRLDFRRK